MPRSDAQAEEGQLIAVGKLGKVWGVHGDVTVRLHNPDSAMEWADDVIWVRAEDFPLQAVAVHSWAEKGSRVVARFEGVESPEDARALTHLELLVPRDWLAEPEDRDELLVADLIGMAVHEEQLGPLGAIVDVFNAGASDIWVVRDGADEVLIPAIKDVVLDVDAQARVIRVRYQLDGS